MISFNKTGCCKPYGARQLILDTEKDVDYLPRNNGSQGSVAYVIETGNKYICNHLGQWSLVKGSSSSGGGSGSGGGNTPSDEDQEMEIVYDGGTIGENPDKDTEVIVIYDGMEVI